MASSKDIGGLHATLTANASQYVAEFNRADKATQMAARGMTNATETLMHDIQRNFTGAKFAKGILEGFGIGTGITAITRLADVFVGMWKEGDEYAKKVEERAENIAKIMSGLSREKFDLGIELKKSDLDKLSAVTAEINRLKDAMAAAEATRESAVEGLGYAAKLSSGQGLTGTFAGQDFTAYNTRHQQIGGMPAKEAGDILSSAADAAQQKWAELNKELLARLKEERALTAIIQKNKDAQTLLSTSPQRDYAAIKDISPETEAFVSGLVEKLSDKEARAQDRTPDAPLTDAFTRLGLLGGTGETERGKEEVKQTSVLMQIRDAILRQTTTDDALAGFYA